MRTKKGSCKRDGNQDVGFALVGRKGVIHSRKARNLTACRPCGIMYETRGNIIQW